MTKPWTPPQGRNPHRQPRLRARSPPANVNMPDVKSVNQMEMMKPEMSFNVKKMVVEMAEARRAQNKEEISEDKSHSELQMISFLEMLMHEFHKHGISSILTLESSG